MYHTWIKNLKKYTDLYIRKYQKLNYKDEIKYRKQKSIHESVVEQLIQSKVRLISSR